MSPLQVVDEPQEAEQEGVGYYDDIQPRGLAAGGREREESKSSGAGKLGAQLKGPSDGGGTILGGRGLSAAFEQAGGGPEGGADEDEGLDVARLGELRYILDPG